MTTGKYKMRMTLYRVIACDDYTKYQAQYALSAHQEVVKHEPWFLTFVLQTLTKQIEEKVGDFDTLIGDLVWRGVTEEWEYVGDGWTVDED
jgi:hypothetical protein